MFHCRPFLRAAAVYSPKCLIPIPALTTRAYVTTKIISRSTSEKISGDYNVGDYGEPPKLPAKKNNATNATPSAPASAPAPAQAFQNTEQFGANTLPIDLNEPEESRNWSKSFHGLSVQPFGPEVSKILLEPLEPNDIEIKPDGLLYLPEIKYRRILNKAFGPGGWGLAPRGEHSITDKNISREYALVCHGRFVSQARGEQDYFDPTGIPTAAEGCKSNALMRCCKDLGIASELWDPSFIRKFKKQYCVESWVEHVMTKKKRKHWRRRDGESGM
ncbi:mitochondrial genome maintenance MGM101-domain-containing protein [Jimgerdemannia flammicorona]|uniref:Mitochondrial genome maintenance protein MGM101 n=1 Tax=Jimgerdemannia flammicorona TaxID=994334 RepID=A0A433CW93_9FUNG|nr:mitochondrial genome maintenance MGM101-domain-containing protein [Jimgerdemannia flammicorona]